MKGIILEDLGNTVTPLITKRNIRSYAKIVVKIIRYKEETTMLVNSKELRLIADYLDSQTNTTKTRAEK